MKLNFKIFQVLFSVLLLSILFYCKKEALKTAPVVAVTTASSITANSASSGGNVSADGGASVTSRGVCWSTSQNPTTSDSKTSDGSGVGSFSSAVTGLNPGVTYTLKAYAINSVGTSYSSSTSFSTLALAPVLTTTDFSSVTATSFNSGGNVTNDGGSPVTARGVCWSTNQNPTIADNKTSDGTGIGSFTSSITGLTPGVTYYARAYASNSIGSAYGLQITVKTSITLATIATASISNITSTTASGGGNITSDGGAAVTVRGVCWSTSQSPTISDSKTSDGGGIGAFSSNITGLSANTTYYIRAYAINNQGTAYGTQVSFKTAALPVVTTNAISAFTSSTATTGGNVTNDGGASITSRGVCWNTTQSPTTSNNTSTNGSGLGVFTSNLTGLSPNTTYYVRAFATNSNGTAYGNQVVFTTDPITVSDIDGNSYKVVRIGTQLWMAENLKTTTFNDGTVIPMVSGNSTWVNLDGSAAYCWYNNNPSVNKNLYGALYNWWAVNSNKLCPTGWSVTNLEDWTTLDTYLVTNSAGKLKETGTTHWISPNTGATNETEFTALPGGYRDGFSMQYYGAPEPGLFYSSGSSAYFWNGDTFVGITDFSGYYVGIQSDNGSLLKYKQGVYGNSTKRSTGLSVRCLKK